MIIFLIHIVPRRVDDFDGQPDRFYDALQKNDRDGKPRSIEEMAEEANVYRKLM